MYHLSGVAGAASIVACFLLLFELAGCPLTGGPEGSAPHGGRVLSIALVAVISGVASLVFHRRSVLDHSRPKSGRLVLAEGILMSLLGVLLLAGAVFWLQRSGGVFGLHIPGFLLGGCLLLGGLRRLMALK